MGDEESRSEYDRESRSFVEPSSDQGSGVNDNEGEGLLEPVHVDEAKEKGQHPPRSRDVFFGEIRFPVSRAILWWVGNDL